MNNNSFIKTHSTFDYYCEVILAEKFQRSANKRPSTEEYCRYVLLLFI